MAELFLEERGFIEEHMVHLVFELSCLELAAFGATWCEVYGLRILLHTFATHF